jgi:hypothetical protein
VVVKLAAALWRSALGASRQVCFGAVLLTGSGSQSNHFGGVPWMPGWMQTQGIEALLWDSELRSIGIQPQQGQVGAAVFNTKFVPPPFLSAPLWSPVSSQGSTVTGLVQSSRAVLNPKFVPSPFVHASASLPLPGQASSAEPATQAASPTTGLDDATVAAETEAVALRRSPASRASSAAGGSVPVPCNAQLPNLLQAGGRFWSRQAVSGAPAQFAPGEFITSPVPGPADSLGDPAFAASANRSNVIPPGPAGAWCRPPPVPFAQSSPLATYTFWAPFIFLLAAATVLWLSRGVRMPAM